MGNNYTKEQKNISKESIREALFLLMKNNKFQDITISEISNKSGISRTGFYRNYESKEEVLIDYFDFYMKTFFDEINNINQKDPYNISLRFFNYVETYSLMFERVIQSGGETILFERFSYYVGAFYTKNVKTIPFNGVYEKYWNRFVSAGLYYTTIEWIKNDKKESKEELAKIVTKLSG